MRGCPGLSGAGLSVVTRVREVGGARGAWRCKQAQRGCGAAGSADGGKWPPAKTGGLWKPEKARTWIRS